MAGRLRPARHFNSRKPMMPDYYFYNDERQQEEFDDRIMREVGTGCAGAIVFWLVLVILMLCFASCKTRTIVVETVRTDTTYIAKTDSVPVPYPVEVRVPRELSWWQKALQSTGGIALILLLVWIGRQAWKIYTKRFY